MDLKKGLSYVAFGFFFTLVDLNLISNGATVNVLPDFIGWILLFLAFDRLGVYTEGKTILKGLSLVLIVLSAAVWILGIARPELPIGYVSTVVSVLSAVYMFILFGVLQTLAGDLGSPRESTIGMLRILNPLLLLAFMVVGLLAYVSESTVLAGLTVSLGAAALVAAIVTMVVLFQLRKEVS